MKVASEIVRGVVGTSNKSLCLVSGSGSISNFFSSCPISISSKLSLTLGERGIGISSSGIGNLRADSSEIVKVEVAFEPELEAVEEEEEVRGLNSMKEAVGVAQFLRARYHPFIGLCIVHLACRFES